MRAVIITAVLLVQAFALKCPNGYVDGINYGVDGVCFGLNSNLLSHNNAERSCNNDSATLIHIHNQFENTMMTHAIAGANAWIGLRCEPRQYYSDSYNCYWDDDGSVVQYTNFYQNNINTDIGSCVYMIGDGVNAGKWMSASCGSMGLPSVCTYDPNQQEHCGRYTLYNHMCYNTYYANVTDYATAESICQNDCGHLVSIHSAAENFYVMRTVENNADRNFNSHYIYLGVQNQGSGDKWNDASPFNYSNYVSGDTVQQCAMMAVTDDTIPAGFWKHSACTERAAVMCKRAPGACIPTSVPPVQSDTCKGTTQLSGNGTLLSPGYPNQYSDAEQNCQYSLTVASGVPVFRLDEYYIDKNSNLSGNANRFYISGNGRMNTTGPFFNTYTSSMQVTFNADRIPSDNDALYRWKGHFVSSADILPVGGGCNATVSAKGAIASPNFPNYYDHSKMCEYQINASANKRVRLTVSSSFEISSGDDLYFYSGTKNNKTQLGSQDFYSAAGQFTSIGNQMYVRFAPWSAVSDQYRGWIAIIEEI